MTVRGGVAGASEIHSATWFSSRGDRITIRAKRGSRPGSPWAELLFGVLFSRVLRRSQDTSVNDEAMFTPAIPCDGRLSVSELKPDEVSGSLRMREIVYADDLAVSGACRLAKNLQTSTARLPGAVLDSFYGHGMQPNMGPSKTSAVLAPCGSGSQEVRRSVYTPQQSRMPVLLENAASVMLHVFPSYQHLGCRIKFAASLDEEVLRQLQTARAAFREGRKLVYCNSC